MHTQNLQILREDTLRATCSAGPFCLLPTKEQRRRRAEKRLSKSVFLESPFLLCPLKVFRTLQVFLRTNLKGAEKKRTLQKHPFLPSSFPVSRVTDFWCDFLGIFGYLRE